MPRSERPTLSLPTISPVSFAQPTVAAPPPAPQNPQRPTVQGLTPVSVTPQPGPGATLTAPTPGSPAAAAHRPTLPGIVPVSVTPLPVPPRPPAAAPTGVPTVGRPPGVAPTAAPPSPVLRPGTPPTMAPVVPPTAGASPTPRPGMPPPVVPAVAPAQATGPRPPVAAPARPAPPTIAPMAPAVPGIPAVPAVAASRPLAPAVPPVAPGIAPIVPPVAPAAAAAGAAPPPPPPAATGKGSLDPAQAAELEVRCSQLDELDYFEVLKIPKDAAPAAIKKAFYSESRTYHPDRFYQLESKELKERVHELYKRITEAYYVLRDDTKRKKYLADVTGPERAQKLRFTENSEAETKAAVRKEQEEQIGTHPKGRQFYQLGASDFDAGRWSSAERNLKMALTYEPANARYKEKLAEAKKKLEEEAKSKGDSFKIK